MEDYEDILVEYYDDFQSKLFNYAQEVEVINNVLKIYSAKDVVDLGCGTGRHIINLAKLGYRCVGVDKSINMLTKAKENADNANVNVRFINADIRYSALLREYYGAFDASICIRNTLSSADDIKLALKTHYDLLREGGIMIFDTLLKEEGAYDDEILNMDVVVRNKTYVVRLNDFKIQSNKVDCYFVYFIQDKGTMRMIPTYLSLPLFNIDEMIKILASVGFKYKSVIYEYVGIPRTKSVIILAEKTRNTNVVECLKLTVPNTRGKK